MKKALALSSVLIMLFAGCSSKSPEIGEETGNESAQETTQGAADTAGTEVEAETIVVDEEVVEPAVAMPTMEELEAKMTTIHFAFDKYNITTASEEVLGMNAVVLGDAASNYNVKVEGNCDEWGSDEYNFALGLKRAKAAKDVLVEKGIDPSRISMVSYGESNPVCTEHTKECWAKNRRDDFKLLP